MKKVFSLLLLLIIIFLGVQFLITKLTKSYVIDYVIKSGDDIFNIKEKYSKEYNDSYYIEINYKDNLFVYNILNVFNKQKEIIKDIKVYNDNNNYCLVPILSNNKVSYIECVSDNNIYLENNYPNQNHISTIKANLVNDKYVLNNDDISNVRNENNTLVYTNNILENEYISLWDYKGIRIFNKKDRDDALLLTIDKYQNDLGRIVGKYYVMPLYTSSLFEFDKVYIVNMETGKHNNLSLTTTLSNDTYVNGIIDKKLYYTDPYNLIQIEVDPYKEEVEIIGNKEKNGVNYYDGSFHTVNIYDLVSSQVSFNKPKLENFAFDNIYESNGFYIVYSNNNLYQIFKDNLNTKVLLLTSPGISNIKVINNDIYYVIGDTLYRYNNENGIKTLLKNNDLIYNNLNRIDIYRK